MEKITVDEVRTDNIDIINNYAGIRVREFGKRSVMLLVSESSLADLYELLKEYYEAGATLGDEVE